MARSGFAARLTLMKVLVACCAVSASVGVWLTRSGGGYSVASIWWVAALFTILRLIGNAAFVARETLSIDRWCSGESNESDPLCVVD